MKLAKFTAVLAGLGLLFGTAVQAARVVEVTANGNSYTDFDFWSVSFTTSGEETVSLSAIRIDLGTLSGAFFDFDGFLSLACPADSCVPLSPPFLADRSGEGPIFNSGIGVSSGDVDFNYDPLTDPERPTSLDLTLTNVVGGDSFSFGADTDGAPDGATEAASFNTGDELAGAQLTAFFFRRVECLGVLCQFLRHALLHSRHTRAGRRLAVRLRPDRPRRRGPAQALTSRRGKRSGRFGCAGRARRFVRIEICPPAFYSFG